MYRCCLEMLVNVDVGLYEACSDRQLQATSGAFKACAFADARMHSRKHMHIPCPLSTSVYETCLKSN